MAESRYRRLTLGVEEEFQLIRPGTLELVPGFDNLAASQGTEAAANREPACQILTTAM